MQLNEEVIRSFGNLRILSNIGEMYKEKPKTNRLKQISKSIAGLKWENICLEEVNKVTGWLAVNHSNDYDLYWNSMVKEINERVIPDIIIQLDDMLLADRITESIKTAAIFDVINIIMVNSYSELIHSTFYAEMLDIYMAGHLAYGWEGKYPLGKILVF